MMQAEAMIEIKSREITRLQGVCREYAGELERIRGLITAAEEGRIEYYDFVEAIRVIVYGS